MTHLLSISLQKKNTWNFPLKNTQNVQIEINVQICAQLFCNFQFSVEDNT